MISKNEKKIVTPSLNSSVIYIPFVRKTPLIKRAIKVFQKINPSCEYSSCKVLRHCLPASFFKIKKQFITTGDIFYSPCRKKGGPHFPKIIWGSKIQMGPKKKVREHTYIHTQCLDWFHYPQSILFGQQIRITINTSRSAQVKNTKYSV